MDVLVIKIDGVEGEATLEGFEKQIMCLAFSHSVHNHLHTDVSNVGRARGRVEHSDFTITKYADKASPLLNYKCCIGANLGQVTFTVLRASGEKAHVPQMIYTLENTMVSNVSIGGGGEDTPVETVSLNYTKIKWEVKVQSQDMKEPGSIASEWDVNVNKGADS
jgi:type VI secretion system secreted protein Hcp